jgi:hypothetical protein
MSSKLAVSQYSLRMHSHLLFNQTPPAIGNLEELISRKDFEEFWGRKNNTFLHEERLLKSLNITELLSLIIVVIALIVLPSGYRRSIEPDVRYAILITLFCSFAVSWVGCSLVTSSSLDKLNRFLEAENTNYWKARGFCWKIRRNWLKSRRLRLDLLNLTKQVVYLEISPSTVKTH